MIKWDEIPSTTRNNFKRWLAGHTKEYDDKFSAKLFDDLSDDIKVKFIFEFAKRFSIKNIEDLTTFARSLNDMKIGVKKLKITDEIQEAIHDVIPDDVILKTIKKSDMGSWDATENIAYSDAITTEEIAAARDNRKSNIKRTKLIARAKTIKSVEQYSVLFSDPLMDHEIFEIILKRLEKQTAFTSQYLSVTDKESFNLIINWSGATTDDLIRINKMKSKQGWNGVKTPIYNNKDLNSAIASKADAPLSEVMKMVKLQQFDIKLSAAKRNDLSPADKDILVEYSIRHHAHMNVQLTEIFTTLGIKLTDYQNDIINAVKQKYIPSKKYSDENGFKFLKVIDTYGWLRILDEETKENVAKIIVRTYERNAMSKDAIVKALNNLSELGIDYLTSLYEKTGDGDFLPDTVKDIFVF